MAYQIEKEKCIGCGACAFVCLFDVPALAADGVKYEIDKEKCTGCGQCENMCPVSAISPLPDHKKIKKVSILTENCIGCSMCARVCPAGAPHGELKSPFEIDQDKCFRCGTCAKKCRKEAILVEYEN